MAEAKLEVNEKSDATFEEKDKDDEASDKDVSTLECAICLQPSLHPAKLPCNHIYCYLCVKGVANQSKRCPMCRQEIPPDFLEKPHLVEVEDLQKESERLDEEYRWFYEGRNGWWQYDQRTSFELETAYKQGKRTCELLIAGFLYIADFGSMLQLRRNDPSRRRRIKRDLYNVPKKGIAGLRFGSQEEEIVREIRGAERPASPASDDMGDDTNTPVPPSNTPQTPAGGTASGEATPLNDRIDQRSDSLNRVLEQMRILGGYRSFGRNHMPAGYRSMNIDDNIHLEESPHLQLEETRGFALSRDVELNIDGDIDMDEDLDIRI